MTTNHGQAGGMVGGPSEVSGRGTARGGRPSAISEGGR